jgi:chorismate mutase
MTPYYEYVMNENPRLYAVRGAVCCSNTIESISEWVPALYRSLLKKNTISEIDIVSVVFSVTDDLNVLNPATALRKASFAENVPLFACAEPKIAGALPSVIRILLTFYGLHVPLPVYLNGAEILRPDQFLPVSGSANL